MTFTRFKLALLTALLLLGSVLPAVAQATATTTTLSAAVTVPAAFDPQNIISVASATNFAAGSIFYIDKEAMCILSVSGTSITVSRGCSGTNATSHVNGGTGYVGLPTFFKQGNPSGVCTSTAEAVLPVISIPTGTLYNCIASYWMIDGGVKEIPPSDCIGTTGNSTGTNGFTTVGASSVGVLNVQSSASGTNTHIYRCFIDLGGRLSAKSVYVKDVVFKYGVQTTALGTQAVVLASGTLNSQAVFEYIDYPAPGASETASTVTPVRADAGTLVLTPVAASFNTATTTAGGFYTEQFTPATPIQVPVSATDRRSLMFSVALLNTATSATITNSPGLTVHYAYIPD